MQNKIAAIGLLGTITGAIIISIMVPESALSDTLYGIFGLLLLVFSIYAAVLLLIKK